MTSEVVSLTPVSPFDLAQFEAADTFTLEVMSQKDEPLLYNGAPVTIEVYGPGTREYQYAHHRLAQANQANAFAAMRGKPVKETVEGNATKLADKLAACTKSVNNFPVAAQEIYTNPKLGYITAQVAKCIEDWANF